MNPIHEHLLRNVPASKPRRISEWATELAVAFEVSEKTVIAVINNYIDEGTLTKRGSQHRTAPHTLRLTQPGYARRAALLLNDRKAQD